MRPRTSLEAQITSLRRRLRRLDEEARRTALMKLMDGLRILPAIVWPAPQSIAAGRPAPGDLVF